jgi:hypothetical protein
LNSRAARHLWNNKQERITRFLDEQVQADKLAHVKIDAIKEPQYIRTQDIDLLLDDDSFPTKRVHLINPFDNIIRERALLAKYWQFQYTLEAYTPPAKRKYGYYLMPILDGHQFIGRLEPKVHRKEQILEIKSIFFDAEYTLTQQSLERLHNGIHAFAEFHKCNQIHIGTVSPARFHTRIASLFQ